MTIDVQCEIQLFLAYQFIKYWSVVQESWHSNKENIIKIPSNIQLDTVFTMKVDPLAY